MCIVIIVDLNISLSTKRTLEQRQTLFAVKVLHVLQSHHDTTLPQICIRVHVPRHQPTRA